MTAGGFEIELAQLTEAAGRVARFLTQHTGTGDRVALLAGNTPEFVIARLAATAADRVLVPVNPKLAAGEVAYVLDHAGAAVLLATPALRAVAEAAATGTPVFEIGDACADPPLPLRDAIGATLIYTSGTTGYPKGCLRREAEEAARAAELTATYGLCADDVHLIACPLAHSAPGIFLRAGLVAGARTVVLERFRPASFLEAVEGYRATFFFLVPTQYERLLALPERDRFDVSSVRCAIVAGAPIHPATKRRLIDWLGPDRLWEFYGSSETGTVSVLAPADQLRKPGSVGLPPAGVELRIVTADGREAGPDEVGEIYVRSPTLMSGYLGRSPTPTGFVTVGDLGHRDADGYLYLVDRKHDTIISGGVNVYPAEVERALAEHPSVRGAVVFGVADDDWGQIVCAAVTWDDGSVSTSGLPDATSAESETLKSVPDAGAVGAELRQWLRGRIADFKLPKAIAVIGADELPIGSSGKPLRRRARAELTERLVRLDRARDPRGA